MCSILIGDWENGCQEQDATRQTRDRTVSNEDLPTVLSLLDDEHARQILRATSVDRVSKTELAEECDVSLPTISRRVDRLEKAGLVREETRLRSDGHHDAVYVAQLDRFEVRLADGEFKWDLKQMDRDMSDELERLWGKF